MATSSDSQGRFSANDEWLYVTDSDPTAGPTDPTNYTKVGLLTNNPFEGTSNNIDVADKSVSGFGSSISGTRGYNITVEANRKDVGDDGQKLVRTAWKDGTNLWWLISTNTSGDECKHGEANVTDWGEPSNVDSLATMTATLSGQNAPTFTTVPSS